MEALKQKVLVGAFYEPILNGIISHNFPRIVTIGVLTGQSLTADHADLGTFS